MTKDDRRQRIEQATFLAIGLLLKRRGAPLNADRSFQFVATCVRGEVPDVSGGELRAAICREAKAAKQVQLVSFWRLLDAHQSGAIRRLTSAAK